MAFKIRNQSPGDWRNSPLAILALALIPAVLWGQNSSDESSALTDGKNEYAERCAMCHGEDAQGTDRAPELAGNRKLRTRSVEQISEIIHHGIPAAGMPAFDLPAGQLEALAAFVHSLNSPADENLMPGNAAAGEQFFFSKGQCTSCHMVDGRGQPIGPDLSDVGRELTIEGIRQALLNPGAHMTAGYDLVTVTLRDGKTIRGFARNRSNFDIELQDLKGGLHSLQSPQIAAVQEDKQPFMPPVKASPEESQNLIAYLSRLTGVKPGMTIAIESATPVQPGDITFSRILDPRPGDWLTYNGNLSGNRYSGVTQINRDNVSRLIAKWTFSIPHFGLEVTPIVADGIMYVTGPNQAFALDAVTGSQIWQYSRPTTPGLIGDAALGTNRGLAILGNKVFMMTDNAHLIALNRITGSLMWEAVLPDELQHYGSTVSPLVVKDLVIAGVSGGDRGIRGFLAAYKASTGERVWRDWTVPKRGEPGSDTWKEKEPVVGGGATWLTGSYDPETDTLYWPTGNPYPDSDDRERSGDNLFTDSILALNPDTGKPKWYYQCTPHDIHDWDATEPLVLADTQYRGEQRKLLLHADRNGFFYVLDRTNGKVLLAHKFVQLSWASGVGRSEEHTSELQS